MRVIASVFAALALVAAVGQAAPFDAAKISADAKWVVHVDVDAVRDSTIVKKSFETCPLLKSESGKHFDKIVEQLGIDLRKDLHGITIYGTDTDKDHGVAIVFAKINRKPLLEKAQKAADHKVVKHGAVEIHTWTHTMGLKTRPGAGAFYKPGVLVLASSEKAVEDAIDVLAGKSPGLTDPKSALGGHVYTGSTLLARSIAMPADAHCEVIKQLDGFRIAMGENKGKSFYRARLFMKTAESAEQIKAINDGIKAVAALHFGSDADVKKLVDGMKTTVKDKTVSVRWDASTDDVWAVVEKLAKKAMGHFQSHHAEGTKTSAATTAGGDCPCMASGECPVCKAIAQMKATSAGTSCECPAGCQCAACKAKAAAKATSK
jgi:hypothetical protein